MRSVYNQCSNGVAGDHPTFGVTTRTVFEAFEGLLLATERFTSKGEADGGFKNEVLKFKGCKLAYDDCRRTELRKYRWNFAIKRVVLVDDHPMVRAGRFMVPGLRLGDGNLN